MHFTAFENAYFLQSIGWAILNSFWQGGCLLLLYCLLSLPKKTSAIYKYNLSLLFLFASFAWFVFTMVQTYFSLQDASFMAGSIPISIQGINALQINETLPYLSFIYIGLVGVQITRFIYSYKKISFLQKSPLQKAPLDVRLFIRNIAAHIGIRKEINIWLSENISVPSVIGFFKPAILLPAAVLNHLTTEQLEAVLLHELAHIKRNDYFINLLQSFVEIALAFNPFAILLSNYAKKERENCCDDWVLNYQYDRHQYANALLVLEEQRHQQLVLAMAATNKKGILLNRIKRMFYAEPTTDIRFIQKLQLAIVCMLFFAGLFYVIPFINSTENKPVAQAITSKNHFINQASAVIYPVNYKEPIIATTTTTEPKTKSITPKRRGAKRGILKTNEDYTIAFINNDLVRQNRKPIAIAANENETVDSSYYVKIEEQQSGEKRMNVYYFQLNKDKGNNTIKPLILLQKPIEVKTKADPTTLLHKRVTS